jgi:hypothetical protein
MINDAYVVDGPMEDKDKTAHNTLEQIALGIAAGIAAPGPIMTPASSGVSSRHFHSPSTELIESCRVCEFERTFKIAKHGSCGW